MVTDDKTEESSPPPLPPQGESTAEEPQFRLLDLPLELVVRVLGFAVAFKQEDQFAYHPNLKPSRDAAFHSTKFSFWAQPAITRTCRLLRNEGLPLFYSTNRFSFAGSDEDATTFWSLTRSPALQHLRKMQRVHVLLTGMEGERWPEDIGSMTYDDFLGEIKFQKQRWEMFGKQVATSIGMLETKVKLSSIAFEDFTFYQLSFADDPSENWRDINSFETPQDDQDPDDDDEYERACERCERYDWWTKEPQTT